MRKEKILRFLDVVWMGHPVIDGSLCRPKAGVKSWFEYRTLGHLGASAGGQQLHRGGD